MKGGLLGWEIYLWGLAGAESLLVWGILAGWTEGKVFSVARLKRSSIAVASLPSSTSSGGGFIKTQSKPLTSIVYILLPLTQAHTSSTYPPTPPHQPTHPPPHHYLIHSQKPHLYAPLPLSPLLTTPSPYIPTYLTPPPSSTAPPSPSKRKNITHTHPPTCLRSSILTYPTYLPYPTHPPTHLAKQNHRTKSSPTTQPNRT